MKATATRIDLDGLLRVRAWRPEVLSLYLTVPADRAELRGLPQVSEFLAEAACEGRLSDGDRTAIRETVEAHSQDWRGRSVAIFTSAALGLHEVVPLARAIPGYEVPERAVLACRPHVLPLVAALQWYPAFLAVVVSKRHAWVFSVAEAGAQDTIETMATPAGSVGWYGLDASLVLQRITQLARHHYHDTAALLAGRFRDRGPQPLVIGGCEDGVAEFLNDLPAAVRESFAGSFTADPHALTPSRVRDLAAPVAAQSADRAARHLAAGICRLPLGKLGAAGLPACLAAVNGLTVDQLVAPVSRLVPGYACGTCGQLGTAARCADCRLPAAPVPDLIDEMACQVLDGGGHVVATCGDGSPLAARLRPRDPS